MSHAVSVFVTFVLTVLFCAKLQIDTDRGNVQAGILVVDKVAYRIVPLANQ